ncbi:bifunctional phosphopantothenoylcysteine decarboxylase/phosphopantothenate--cysteine ligase CoaBC [Granulicella sp. dw_53]|uniref:bifunctional phosphopantothenoylcysteine decarboxylase/phosphopantothenate--cysteine ligase CoaBC n=1 Tax=Granulicella sp. dw_53 TaxID=2719792 RepID=UPI001BD412B3|nr:bifunctional phosphopantothenoylcysteine decarboxylase/phosphopantothenate--cysteine ligase CoaBC [Granulicella sp. dw_53]
MSAGKIKVTVGVCGGIAAYKAVELVRLLQDAGLDPHVVMTAAAERFVTPLTFSAISGHKVITSLWDDADPEPDAAIEHIDEAQTTQALIVVPATANILGKFAGGLADDFLTTLYLATIAPVIVAPAMNVNMWNHPATQANLTTLRQRGVQIVEPGSGYLACGMIGSGRLADNSAIVAATLQALKTTAQTAIQDLAGETVLVTAGGTREAIDPVRFLGNRSSGRMGYALAEAARQRGARVILISAPTSLPAPDDCELIKVISAAEMRRAVLDRLPESSLLIMAAAVSDFRVRHPEPEKIKRNGPLLLELDPTEDILREAIGLRKPGTLVIAFAAETNDLLVNARAKLEKKGADAIVANDISAAGLGFDSERNSGVFLTRHNQVEIPATTKQAMAHRILDEALALKANLASTLVKAPALI